MLGHARLHCRRHRRATHVADARTFTDQLVFFRRLDRPHPHRGLSDIDKLDPRQRCFKLAAVIERDMVELDPHPSRARQQLPHRPVEIVAAPVGVGDVAARAAPPGLSAVDPGRDGRGLILRDHHPVLPAEETVEPARVVVDAMIRGEQRRIDIVLGHPPAHVILAPPHLGVRERREFLVAVVPFHDVEHVFSHDYRPFAG